MVIFQFAMSTFTIVYPLKITMLLMGKSTISMAMFHHFLYVYQRVKHAMQAAD
jgi:hypothetical protein